jgi:hypothetical protein
MADEARPPIDPSQFVEMTFTRMFCPVHGEPFREQWPRGAALFQLPAIAHIFGLQDFWAELDRRFPGEASEAEFRSRVGVMFDLKPVCCRLGPAKLLEFYVWQHEQGGIGRRGFCCSPHCNGTLAFGTAFKQALPNGRVEIVPHICFRCVAHYVIPRAN